MAPRIEMKKIWPRNIAERPSTRTCNAPPGTAQRSDMPSGDGATNASTAALTPAIPATAIREQAIRSPARPFRDENRPGKPLSAANAHFFFQAEDGIRDLYVTGVQTCALPI